MVLWGGGEGVGGETGAGRASRGGAEEHLHGAREGEVDAVRQRGHHEAAAVAEVLPAVQELGLHLGRGQRGCRGVPPPRLLASGIAFF